MSPLTLTPALTSEGTLLCKAVQRMHNSEVCTFPSQAISPHRLHFADMLMIWVGKVNASMLHGYETGKHMPEEAAHPVKPGKHTPEKGCSHTMLLVSLD